MVLSKIVTDLFYIAFGRLLVCLFKTSPKISQMYLVGLRTGHIILIPVRCNGQIKQTSWQSARRHFVTNKEVRGYIMSTINIHISQQSIQKSLDQALKVNYRPLCPQARLAVKLQPPEDRPSRNQLEKLSVEIECVTPPPSFSSSSSLAFDRSGSAANCLSGAA